MTAFVEKFALEIATTLVVGAVTGFLYGLSSTREPASRASGCPNCGAASRDDAGPRHAA